VACCHCQLSWLDAFDFFVVIFLVGTLAVHSQVTKSAIIWMLTATLALRPVAALGSEKKGKSFVREHGPLPFGSDSS